MHIRLCDAAMPLRRPMMVALLAMFPLLLQTQDAAAQRKGFILNLGLGVGQFHVSGEGGDSESRTAISTDFKIGHAFSDQLMLYYSNDAAFFSSDEESDDLLHVSGLSGVSVTYFLKPSAPSFYFGGGIGISVWSVLSDDGDTESLSGGGLAVTGGYEFSPHFLLDVDLIFGSPGDDSGDVNTRTIRVGLNWLLY